MISTTITVEYDLPLPNEYLVDHSFSEGKTRKETYVGPDKIYLQIGEDGREKSGPLTADDIADGRPMPADVVEWFEIDCATNPLLCELRGQPVPKEDEEVERVVHPESPVIAGYPQYEYLTPIQPRDIFDKFSVQVVDGVPQVRPFTVNEGLFGADRELTWNDIRVHRDRQLESSDGKVTDDMPEDLKNEWKEYRQLLRDLPSVMEAAGVSPNIAYYMFPRNPDAKRPTEQERLEGGV